MRDYDLAARKARFDERLAAFRNRIVICGGTGCMANGAMALYDRFRELIAARGLRVSLSVEREEGDVCMSLSGCQGFCQLGPLVTVYPQGIFYNRVRAEDNDTRGPGEKPCRHPRGRGHEQPPQAHGHKLGRGARQRL